MSRTFWTILGTSTSLMWLACTAHAEDGATASAAPSAQVAAATSARAQPAQATKAKALQAPAGAQKAPYVAPDEHARMLKDASLALGGSDPVAIQEALVNLGTLSGRAAAEVIVTRVRGGLPPQLTEQALEVLGTLNQPLATPVLVELAQHRRWQIRQKAVTALGALKVRSTVSVLLFTLDDPSAEVRTAAAAALGSVGDPRALAPLTAALDRGVEGALVAIAQVGSSKQVDFLLTRAKADLRAAEPALWAWLARTNVPAASKVKVIKALDGWNTEDAQNVLAQWQQRLREGTGDARLLTAFKPAAKPSAPAAPAAPAAQPAAAPVAAATPVAPAAAAQSQGNGAKP